MRAPFWRTHNSSKFTTEESELYFKLIDRYAENKENELVNNSIPAHARHLVATLFKTAKENVSLYSTSLQQTVQQTEPLYSDSRIIESALAFLRNADVTLRILLTKELDVLYEQEPKDHPLLKAIKTDEGIRGNFEISKISDSKLSTVNPFLVVDRRAFRLEIDSNNSRVRAVANFNDPKLASLMTKYFDQVFPKANPMRI